MFSNIIFLSFNIIHIQYYIMFIFIGVFVIIIVDIRCFNCCFGWVGCLCYSGFGSEDQRSFGIVIGIVKEAHGNDATKYAHCCPSCLW